MTGTHPNAAIKKPELELHGDPMSHEAPPPYSEYQGPSGPSTSSERTPLLPNTGDYHSATAPPLDLNPRTIVYEEVYESDEEDESCLAPVFDPVSWGSMFYLAVVGPLYMVLAFVWVLVTFIVSVVLLVIPPVGIICLIASAFSYRILTRVELETQSFFCSPNTSQYIHPPLNPPNRTVAGQFMTLLFSRTTLLPVLYFLFIKPIIMVVFFSIAVTAISIALPLAVCFLPATCIVCRSMGRAQGEWAWRLLGQKRVWNPLRA